MVKLRSLLCAVTLAVLATAGPGAQAAPAGAQVFVSAYQYFPGDEDYTVEIDGRRVTGLVVEQGGAITFSNLDVGFQSHSLTADSEDANGVPLFDSTIILANRSTDVHGIDRLPPGVYGFHCRQHDWTMHGYLQVV